MRPSVIGLAFVLTMWPICSIAQIQEIVSDIALSCIGSNIGIDSFDAGNLTDEQWNEWKQKVRAALKKYISTGKTSEPEGDK